MFSQAICGATIERGLPEGSISQKSGDITLFADTVDLVALFMETVDLRALFADIKDGKDIDVLRGDFFLFRLLHPLLDFSGVVFSPENCCTVKDA